MKYSRNNKMFVFIFAFLIVSICLLGIAYSALSTRLVISGKSTFDAATWDIKFENLTGSSIGKAVYTLPVLNKTTLSDFSVTFSNVGDTAEFYFDIVNNGSIDAKILSVAKSQPICNGIGDTSTAINDANIVCRNLVFAIKNYDGTDIKVDDVLLHNTRKKMKLVVGYKPDSVEIPDNDVKITNLDVTFVYGQK